MVDFAYSSLFVVSLRLISSLSLILTKDKLKSRFASVNLGLKWVKKR